MGKKNLLLLVSGVMILVSCSTNAGKETEFTNNGIFCDLPSSLCEAGDSMYVASDKVRAFNQAFPAERISEVLNNMKSKKFTVSKYDGEKTEEAQIINMSPLSTMFNLDINIPLKEIPNCCYFVFYDEAGNIVTSGVGSFFGESDSDKKVSLPFGYPQLGNDDYFLFRMKADLLAYDKAVRAEIIHPDSVLNIAGKAQAYIDKMFNKLVEESKANDKDFDNEGNVENSKSETPAKAGIYGDIPELYEQQIRFNCQHEFYPSQLRNEEMDKIATPDKVQEIKEQLLNKKIHTIDDDGLTRSEAYIGQVQYQDHYFTVNINVPVVDKNVPIKAEFCDINGNVIYTSYPWGISDNGDAVFNRGFLSIGSPANKEEKRVSEAREIKKIAQIRIARAR